MPITWPLVLTCLVLAVVIGGGGFTIGCMIATDHADRQHADQLEAELEQRQARRVPLAARTYRPPRVILACEPDTTPLRAIPAVVAALGRMIGRHPGPDPGRALEAELALSARRAELEIQDMIRSAEAVIGRLGLGQLADDV